MTDRVELRTWRFLLVAQTGLEHSLNAAGAEDLEGVVGHQIREAGMYVAAALATLELQADIRPGFEPVGSVPLTLNQVDQLIAVTTGAVDRLRDVGPEVARQLAEVRQLLIDTDQEIRKRVGLPLD